MDQKSTQKIENEHLIKSSIEYFDFVILGGGLSGCLLFLAMKHAHPHIKILLVERNSQLCGVHTWCFHDHDLPENCRTWIVPYLSKSWDRYEVKFPKLSRILNSKYHCIRSIELNEKIQSKFSRELFLNSEITFLKKVIDSEETEIEINNQKKIRALTVIDARGWPDNIDPQKVAWQKFVGLEVELKNPHNISHVILKDATIPQIDGYRFFYILPFSEKTLLIEDTYYSNHSILKTERIEQEILKYAKSKNWEVEKIHYRETGRLPLPLYPLTEPEADGIPKIGGASLYFHPVTGYTSPQVLKVISKILLRNSLSQESIGKIILEVKNQFKYEEKYYRLLNRMLFLAAEPTHRYQVLERFYHLNEKLIHRFYSGSLKLSDQFRILIGKPPVPVSKAIKVLSDRS